jgi:hypothetical protein
MITPADAARGRTGADDAIPARAFRGVSRRPPESIGPNCVAASMTSGTTEATSALVSCRRYTRAARTRPAASSPIEAPGTT